MKFLKKSTHWLPNFGLLLAMLIGASACNAGQERMSTVGASALASAPALLTEKALKNLQYQGLNEGPVKLTDGEFVGQPFVEGGASRPVVAIQAWAMGDLNQDGLADAVVLLAENSGGSGSFVYLAAVLNEGGNPVNTSTVLLGDRVQIRSIRVMDGKIRVTMLTHAADDPLCCPSQNVEHVYQVNAGQLTRLENE